jgi:cell division septal protein FtsQ
MNGAVKIDIGNGDFENRLYRLESIATNLKSGLNGVDFVDLDYEKKGVVRYKNSSGFSKI